MKYKVGIDPGISGAFALLNDDNSFEDCCDMPITALTGKRNQINAAQVTRIISLWKDGDNLTAYLEQVSAMPGQGVSSMFSFGTSYGIVQGVLAALHIPVVLITPQRWKKAAGLIGKPKDGARTLAQRLYPMAELGRKKDIGKADALLIARFGSE